MIREVCCEKFHFQDATNSIIDQYYIISIGALSYTILACKDFMKPKPKSQCIYRYSLDGTKNWRKIWFCIPYKTHSGSDKHGSISFMIDNMHYVIFRIWEQDSVPWCGEIQNKRLKVLGNTFNLHSNFTLRLRSVVS